ncbi:toll-like receptor 2 isoform X1 [Amphiprion ocellaris]|uniref:Toll-like receptor 2 n=1 Tax=Amphiprion ocellaris TaxID=80972 RepID=A0AAQ5Z6R0_AMPOC|nr:toll-like receptor 2 isoform X1 [Amphiprion ocellaris]XP_054863467.1 toll-like receptor 2 isoform X1 [Amphiprion ocellaris]
MRRPTSCQLALLLLFLNLCRGQGSDSGDGRSDSGDGRSSCHRCDSHLSCNCSHGGFTHIPVVTDRALTIDLSCNAIATVMDDDLMGHTRLRALDLHGNGLAAIQPSAFDSLWSLEELDLSDNQLAALNYRWFRKLEALQQLNLLSNPYSCLGSPPLFQGLIQLRRLAFGGPALEELRRGDLSGVTQLEELTVHANNLTRYESGTLADIWPLGRVTLSLHGPFLTNMPVASAVLGDVSYPETPITLEDLHLIGNWSVQPLRESARKRIRHLSFRNLSVSDEAVVSLLVVVDGVPITYLSVDGITLTGEGRWEKASYTDQRSIDEFFAQDVVVLDVFKFFSLLDLKFLLQYLRRVSVINSKVFVMPCITSKLLVNLQYLDLSDNLLTDLTLVETLCGDHETLKELRVLNISGNPLKSLSTVSRLVTKLSKLTHLDVSRTGYISMPPSCPWPSTLRHLNISGAKLTTTTPCLPATLEVLDLSNNNLRGFTQHLPVLRELHLSGNKFLSLPPGQLFPNLQTLTIHSNTLNMFGRLDLQSFRRLESLQAGQNQFVCSCDFVNFLQSALKGHEGIHLTDGEDNYVCDSPLYLQGEPVGRVHLSIVTCHRVLFVSVSCGLVLVVGVLLGVFLWRLHAFWYLKMTWAWLKAKHSSRCRQRHRVIEGSEALLSFDAFVSYSERDAGWVENFLVPELEEPSESDSGDPRTLRSLTLCLHKRDFLPGHWIVDNIMSAMERSRRTVFILSENFVQSDWCRYELDFSHFWLFDGHAGGEAAILVLLEPLSKDDVPKRFYKLRKLMSSTTYLEWPREEERRPEFWRSLRKALRGGDEDD